MDGTHVTDAWEHFEVFDALHHLTPICNPMTLGDLDAVLDQIGLRSGDTLLDVACGHGELAIRAAERMSISAVAVDLSPWALLRCVAAASQRTQVGSIHWVLGDAHRLPKDERYDVVTCLGASWIWHGFRGTAAALVARTRPGGRIAIGDLRLRPGVEVADVSASYGRVLTLDEQQGILRDLGAEVTGRIDASGPGWDAYQDRILESVKAWARAHPGDRAERYLDEQRRWRADHERDRQFLDWTVWTAHLAR